MISGPVPDTLASIPHLVHLDLGSNQLNDSIPKFISEMKGLRYLNLERNNFHGVMPFNLSFIKRLEVFKVGENSNLCYNYSLISSKLKLGLAPCDKDGFPVSQPPDRSSSSSDSSSDDGGDDQDYDEAPKKKEGHSHGPNKLVLGVAIGLSSIVFLIIFIILLSKWCR